MSLSYNFKYVNYKNIYIPWSLGVLDTRLMHLKSVF